MKKAVFFDLDDTLYDAVVPNNHALDWLTKQLKEAFIEIDEVEIKKLYEKARTETFFRLATSSAGNRLLHIQRFFETQGKKLDWKWLLKTEEGYWNEFFKFCLPKNDLIEMLQGLKTKGVKIAIVTNMDLRTQVKKLVVLGINDLVDVVVTAEEVGVAKPNPAIFYTALAKLNLKVADVLMVGDDIRPDILGANAIGIETVLIENGWYKYTQEERGVATHKIENLIEVIDLV